MFVSLLVHQIVSSHLNRSMKKPKTQSNLKNLVSLCFLDPPFISKARGTGTPVGQKGVLQCEASAVPRADFEWYKEDRRQVSPLSSSPDDVILTAVGGALTLIEIFQTRSSLLT